MKKTSWFAILVAVLVAGTYYLEFYSVQKEEKQKGEEAKIVGFPVDQIDKVELQNASGKVLLKRDVEGWRLEEPLKDWADNTYTEDFVSALAAEKSIEVAAEGENINWAVYGLDKDTSQISFYSQSGDSILVTVSAKKNFEGNTFLRRGQESRVLVGSSQWALRTAKGPLDFRDKRLFRGKISSVEGLQVQSEKDQFQLTLKETKWSSEKHPELNLDQNKVREILSSLNEVRALAFFDSAPSGTTKSSLRLKMKDKDWSAEIKQAKDKTYFAVVSDPQFVLKLDPGQVDRFIGMTLMSLRNRREPFDFQNLLVRRIELQTKVKKMTLIKNKETWELEENPKAPVDQAAVRGLIARLSDSAITEYLDPKEQAAFGQADNKLVLKDEAQKSLYELSWGGTLKKKAVVGERALILAKSSLFKDVFGLDPAVVESWGLMKLMSPEQNKEKPKEDARENSH